MLLPHTMSVDNFCSTREEEDEATTMTLYDWLHRWFGADEEAFEALELKATEQARDLAWQDDNRIPLEGSDDDTLVYLLQFLSPHEQYAMWCDLLGLSPVVA